MVTQAVTMVISSTWAAMFPTAHTAWSQTLVCRGERRLINIGTAPNRAPIIQWVNNTIWCNNVLFHSIHTSAQATSNFNCWLERVRQRVWVSVCVHERERERDKDRDREGQRERETEREKERQRQREGVY